MSRGVTLDHIAIAVGDLEQALSLYRAALGLAADQCGAVERFQDMRLAFLELGETSIELLQGATEESVISAFVKTRGSGVHHLAVRVADVEAEVRRLRAAGVRLVEPAPRPGAHGTRVAFVHPKSVGGVLLELVEK